MPKDPEQMFMGQTMEITKIDSDNMLVKTNKMVDHYKHNIEHVFTNHHVIKVRNKVET